MQKGGKNLLYLLKLPTNAEMCHQLTYANFGPCINILQPAINIFTVLVSVIWQINWALFGSNWLCSTSD